MEVLTLIVAIIFLLLGLYFGKLIGKFIAERKFKEAIKKERKDAVAKSRHVITGLISEQLAPIFPNFPYNPNDVRFIGKPVDFIVFNGMSEKEIEEVVFLEIKSGDSRLSSQEKKLKETIDKKRVRFEEYRIKT